MNVARNLQRPLMALGVLVVFGVGVVSALGLRSLVVPTASADPAAPNPGHSWSQIGDLPGTMWHSNNDGSGSGLDADLLDGQHASDLGGGHWTQSGSYIYPDNMSWNVGIGTTSPQEKLHVAGAARFDVGGPLSITTPGGWPGVIAYPSGAGGHRRDISFDASGIRLLTSATSSPGGAANGITIREDGSVGILTNNPATTLHVNGGLRVEGALRVEPNATSPNIIGGYSANSVTGSVVGATIGGGGESAFVNRVTDDYGTVGGGGNNQAGNNAGTTVDRSYATVGGGQSNTATGSRATVGGGQANEASSSYASVGGGFVNSASGYAATVGGGQSNEASNNQAGVGGGFMNTASGLRATVPGGESNTAAGNYSFASGRRAKANNQGCFVWGDSTNADLACNNNDRFLVRASGGVYLYTNSTLTSGSRLTAGGSSWGSLSDRSVKANFEGVDGQDILERLASVPVETWNLKSQDESIRHIGPMAQDFYAAFGVGEDNKYITTSDADGVALAAIQGLYELMQETKAENAALKERVAELEEGDSVSASSSQQSSSGAPATWLLISALAVGALAFTMSSLVLVERRVRGAKR